MTHFVQPAHLAPYNASNTAVYRALWTSQRTMLTGLWSAITAGVLANPPPMGTSPAFRDPRVFASQAARASAAPQLMDGLEGLFARDRAAFERWLWSLVTDVRRRLLYDELLEILDGHDIAYSRRLAAMLYSVLNSPPALGSPLFGWVYQWRGGFFGARGTTLPRDVASLLLVPGRSRQNWPWGNGAAEAPSRQRARGALPTVRHLAQRLPSNKRLLVVCSGGMVRSPFSEASFIADELTKGMRGWSATLRRRVVLVQDPLARHTANNARTLARIALLTGVRPRHTWVVTGPFHFSRFRPTFLRPQWDEWAMAGLEDRDRAAIRRRFPVGVPRGTSLVQIPPAHRARLTTLRPTALVPAPGNALDP